MDRYIIETSHTPEDCVHVLDLILVHGYITHYDWGCKDGVHTGWIIIEAEDREQAMLSVPPLIRNKARAIKLNKFSPQDIETFHGKI